MPVRNITSLQPTISIPLIGSPAYTITIERDSGSIDTITNKIVNATITKACTTEIGSFTIELLNNNGEFTNAYNGGEYINVYLDYGSGTTLYFRGRIDSYFYHLSSYAGYSVVLNGRDYPIIADKTITIQFDNTSIINAFRGVSGEQDSEGNYEDGILYETGLTWHPDNPTSTEHTLYATYSDQKVLKIASDLAQRGNYDWYIYYDTGDSTWYFRLFDEESVLNENEPASFGVNIISVDGVGKDLNDEFNRLRVYGEQDNNIIFMKTSEDSNSQSNLWIKDKRITDTKVNSQDEMDGKITFEMSNNTAKEKGTIMTLPLVTLNAGEKIAISIPYCDINNNFVIRRIVTTINNSGILSQLDIQRAGETVASFFKERIDATDNIQALINLNNLDNSFLIDFANGDTGTHSNTEIVDGILRLTDPGAGGTPGTWISPTHTTSTNVTKVELRLKANYDVNSSTLYVSGDAGINWIEIEYGKLYNLGEIGTNLKVKIVMTPDADNPSPKIEKVCLLYS